MRIAALSLLALTCFSSAECHPERAKRVEGPTRRGYLDRARHDTFDFDVRIINGDVIDGTGRASG